MASFHGWGWKPRLHGGFGRGPSRSRQGEGFLAGCFGMPSDAAGQNMLSFDSFPASGRLRSADHARKRMSFPCSRRTAPCTQSSRRIVGVRKALRHPRKTQTRPRASARPSLSAVPAPLPPSPSSGPCWQGPSRRQLTTGYRLNSVFADICLYAPRPLPAGERTRTKVPLGRSCVGRHARDRSFMKHRQATKPARQQGDELWRSEDQRAIRRRCPARALREPPLPQTATRGPARRTAT